MTGVHYPQVLLRSGWLLSCGRVAYGIALPYPHLKNVEQKSAHKRIDIGMKLSDAGMLTGHSMLLHDRNCPGMSETKERFIIDKNNQKLLDLRSLNWDVILDKQLWTIL